MRPLTQDELNQVGQRYPLTPQARAQMIGFEKEDAPIEPQILPLSLNPMKAAATIAADTVGRGVGPRDDYKNDLAQAQGADDVRSVVNNSVSKLENSHLIFGDRDKILAQKNELFRNINAQLAQNNQGELVTHKKSGQVFLRRGEDLTPLDDGMIKQIGRGIRDNVWSLVGAAASVKSGAGFKNNLVRGMIGTSVGGYADYVANSDYIGRELDAKEALAKMGEDALLSAAGDTIIGGAIRGYQGTKGLINEAKDKAAQATQKLKMSGENVKEKVADMTHPLKDVTAKTDIPIYDHVRTGNIRGAEANVADFGADLSIDEQRALRELMEIYTPQSTNANVKLSELAQGAKHIKENSATPEILRGVASKAEDAAQNLASKFADEDTAARQRLVFAKARADEKHINEFNGLIKESPEFAKKYADILEDDTRRFIDEIGASGERTGDEVGDILGEYVKRIKDDYAKTTSEIKNAINANGVKLDERLIRSAAEDVKTYIKSQTDLSPVTNRILKVLDDGADAEALFEARHAVNSLIRQADYKPTKDKLIRLKQSLDDGIFASTGKSGMELERVKNSLYDADVKYSQMKRIEDDSLYDGIQKGTTKELTQAKLDKKFRNTNGKLNEYLSGLDAPSRERLEIEAIKNTLERNIKETMGGKRVVDYSGMLKTLKDNPNYKSEAAKKAIEITEKMNKIHGLDHTLADAFKAPKDPKLQQGFSHNVAVRYLTMAANRAVQNTVKFLPFLQMGKTAASRHAIYNAVMSSSSARELGEKLSKAAMNKDIPVSEKIDIIEMAKAQFKFSNELDKAKADGIVKEAAEQGSKLEQAGAKQVVEKQGSGASIGGLTANSNAHLGSGMVAGTLNSVDEDGNFSPERFAAGFLAGLVGSKAAAVGLRKMTPKLYNQILGAAEKMPQMANGNPRLLGKLYSNGKDVSLNSFAGEKAITANVGKLDQAKAMLEKGADEVEIWQKTGWFKDKDGAWKFEIGDSNAKLNPNFQSGGRLDKLLEHEELFKAYPELKDVRVVKIGDETPSGAALSVKDAAQREKRGIYNVAFNNKKSTIIRKDLDAIDEIIKFEKGEADYMLHGERKSGYGALHIQKHLDTQNNGWVTKQEYLDMGQMLRKSMMEEADDKRIYTYFNDEGIRFRVVIGIGKNKERVISFYSNRKPLKAGLSYNSQNYDGNLPLNDDIIAQNGAKGYYSHAKNEIGLSDLGDKSTLMHEVQHAIQEIEDFARGGDFNTVWSVAAKNIEKKYESELAELEKISNDAWQKYAPLQKEYIKLFDEGLKDTPEAQRLLKQMREFSDESSRADREIRELRQAVNDEQNAITEEDLQEIYRKIHGEAEARNVQNRLNLGGETHPHETFDVNPNETIVSKEDGISYSRKIEEQRFAGTGRDKTTIMYATPHVGTGLAGGTLNAKDENGNFDAEKFAKGFIYGLFGSKITAATLKKTNPKLYDQIVKIAEGNASKEKISSFVNKLKQDELGKLLQKTVTNKDLSTKTKVEIIEAAKSRYAREIK